MNCAEVAATLEETLLYQRDPEWIREALRHAEQCPSCARLVKLHQLELLLAKLPAVYPSSHFLEGVMDRIAQPELLAAGSRPESSLVRMRYAAIFAGAVVMTAAYLVPAAGSSWFGNLLPSVELVRSLGVTTYLARHPPAAVLLAGVASFLIVLGLSLPEHPRRKIA